MEISNNRSSQITDGTVRTKEVIRRKDPEPVPVKTIASDKVSVNIGLKNPDNMPLSEQVKKKYIPEALNGAFGINPATSEDIIESANSRNIAKKISLFLGFSEPTSDRIADNYSDRSLNRTAQGLITKAGEELPAKYIQRQIKNSILDEIKTALPGQIPGGAVKINANTKIAVSRGFKNGEAKAVETLTEKKVIKTLPNSIKPVKGLFGNIFSDGLINGITNTATQKLNDAKNLLKSLSKSKNPVEEVAKEAEKKSIKVIQETKQNIIRRQEGALEHGVEVGTQKAKEKILEKGVLKIETKADAKILEKSLATATEKAIVIGSEKFSVKAAARLAGLMPVIGSAAEGYIMYKDIQQAKEIHDDPKASKTSAVFSDATVLLDGVSLGSTATGILAPVGMLASGLSIVTNLAASATRE